MVWFTSMLIEQAYLYMFMQCTHTPHTHTVSLSLSLSTHTHVRTHTNTQRHVADAVKTRTRSNCPIFHMQVAEASELCTSDRSASPSVYIYTGSQPHGLSIKGHQHQPLLLSNQAAHTDFSRSCTLTMCPYLRQFCQCLG